MKLKMLILINILLLASCISGPSGPPFDYMSYYSGRWELTETQYSEECTPDSTKLIILYSDSTFVSTFSYFWYQDTTKEETISGRWHHDQDMVPYYISYDLIVLEYEGTTKRFEIQLDNSSTIKTMEWGDPEYSGQKYYEWKYAGGDHLSPDEHDDKK